MGRIVWCALGICYGQGMGLFARLTFIAGLAVAACTRHGASDADSEPNRDAAEPAQTPPTAARQPAAPARSGPEAADGHGRAGKRRGEADWSAAIVEKPAPEPGSTALLDSVEVGRHEQFDRVVFEWRTSRPGYHIEYIDRPVRQCGSGKTVPLEGDGWLQIRFESAAAHDADGKPTIERRGYEPGFPELREVVLTCDFEGVVTWVLAVGEPNEYRITELDDPERIAVDVRHQNPPPAD